MAAGVQDALWLEGLLNELKIFSKNTTKIFIDNKSAIEYCKNGGDANRTRHFNIKYHFVRDNIDSKNVELVWVDTKSQLADIMTKPLERGRFELLRSNLMVVSSSIIK